MYEYCYHFGLRWTLPEGVYNKTGLLRLGVPDNAISSVKVPRWWSVTLWQQDVGVGRGVRLTSEAPCLQDLNFNDMTSAVEVKAESLSKGERPAMALVNVGVEASCAGRPRLPPQPSCSKIPS